MLASLFKRAQSESQLGLQEWAHGRSSLEAELLSYVFGGFHRSHEYWLLMAIASSSHD